MPILQQEILKLVYRMLYKLLKLPNVMILFEVFLKDMIRLSERGVFLSGGEAQRICIARAILRNSPILVLDEATAFADPENEYKIQQALQKLIKGKTVIIIAHRLSSITSAHQILVFKEGCLVQKGRHDELHVTTGIYKNMWNAYINAHNWKLNLKK